MDPRIQHAMQHSPDGRLDNPNVLKEDDPPMLRFESGTMKDPVESEKRGIYVPMDCVKVFVRAFGDIKNEVPYIAEKTAYEPTFEQVIVEKTVPVKVIKEDADGNRTEETKYETKEVMEERATYEKSVVSPWLDVLKDKVNNGKITPNYYNHCAKAFASWKESGNVPVDGYPVVEWKMISPAQQEMLMTIGINSVEKVAEMTEDALSAYGMGGRELKKKAAEYLLAGTDQAKSAARIISLEQHLETKADEMSRLEQKVADLQQLIEAQRGVESEKDNNDDPEPGSEDS